MDIDPFIERDLTLSQQQTLAVFVKYPEMCFRGVEVWRLLGGKCKQTKYEQLYVLLDFGFIRSVTDFLYTATNKGVTYILDNSPHLLERVPNIDHWQNTMDRY